MSFLPLSVLYLALSTSTVLQMRVLTGRECGWKSSKPAQTGASLISGRPWHLCILVVKCSVLFFLSRGTLLSFLDEVAITLYNYFFPFENIEISSQGYGSVGKSP